MAACNAILQATQYNETYQQTVPEAIRCFWEADGFEDAIRNTISIGGDSDTLAAITGSIAEAKWGVPEGIREEALGRLDNELLEAYHRFFK
jgi:type I restriction enzyme M protein